MHMPTKGATMVEQTSKADRVKLNRELAQMLKGGIIMDGCNADNQSHLRTGRKGK